MLWQGVKIVTNWTIEKRGILRYDAKVWPNIMKPDGADVDTIYNDLSLPRFHQAEQSADKGCFPTSSPSNDPNLVPSFEGAIDPLKNQWTIRSISNLSSVLTVTTRFLQFCFQSSKAENNGCLSFTFKSQISILPESGQFGGGLFSGIISWASSGIYMYCSSLSAETIMLANIHWFWTEPTR